MESLNFTHQGEPQSITPGLYFGMPEELYHAIPALSASSMKNILTSPPDYYFNSHLNPHREEDAEDDDKKEWRRFGKAAHTRNLEGKDIFDSLYCVEFIAPEGCLDTASDLKQYCDNNGVTYKKSWTKPLLTDAIKLAGLNPLIYDEEKIKYFKETGGRIQLGQKELRRIEIAAAMIENHPELRDCFKGGCAEVSVIWFENGLWFKARFDYLKPAAISDLKTFTNKNNEDIDIAVHKAFYYLKYHVQGVHYTRAALKASQFAQAGVMTTYGQRFTPTPQYLSMLANPPQAGYEFFLVFQKKGGAPLARGKKFKVNSFMWEKGVKAIEEAITLYRQYEAAFGAGIWVDRTPMTDFDDDKFPLSSRSL